MIEDRAVTNRVPRTLPPVQDGASGCDSGRAGALHGARGADEQQSQGALSCTLHARQRTQRYALSRTLFQPISLTPTWQLVDPADPANRLEARAYGAYDPETDTVLLPNTGDITIQTLLHEAGHAVTAAYIENNPNSAEVNALKSTVLHCVYAGNAAPELGGVSRRRGDAHTGRSNFDGSQRVRGRD
jgi:hypothetical protein